MSKKNNTPKALPAPTNTESTDLVAAAKGQVNDDPPPVVSYDTTGNDNDVATEEVITAEAAPTTTEAELVAEEVQEAGPRPPTLAERLTAETYAVRLQFGLIFACLMGNLQDWWIKTSLRIYTAATKAWMWTDTKLTRFGKWVRRVWDNCTPMSKGFFVKLANMARDNPLEDTTEQRLAAMEALLKAQTKLLDKLTKQSSLVDPDMLAKYTKAVLDGRNVLAADLFRGMTGSTIAGAKLQIETLTAEPAPA